MIHMKHTGFLVVVSGWMLVGCGNVVGPEDFLYTYRTGAPSGAPVSPGAAVYAGQQDGYHVLKLRGSGTPSDWFVNVSDKDRTFRCRVNQLPADFPRDFQPLRMEAFETSEDTRDYIRDYLHRNMNQPGAGTADTTPIGGDNWIRAE